MKKLLPVLLALAAGCVSVPSSRGGGAEMRPDSPAEKAQREVAEESFLRLHRAWLDGDTSAAFNLMSSQGITDWLLTRTRDPRDPDWAKLVTKLDAARKVDLDAWIRFNKRVEVPIADRRPESLPESILNSKWLRETWNHYFEAEKSNLRAIAASMEVADVYVEGPGMSVLVRVNKTPTLIYSMVIENGTWKFDYTTRPASKLNK